jgi:hypothetical protein
MAQKFEQLSDRHIAFIQAQKVYFVATAVANGRINLSPKGMDSFTVLSPNRVAWMNITGSGNETSAHVQQDPRMTIMFCSFEEDPLILRLYGHARVIHQADHDWGELAAGLKPLPGARQIFDVTLDLVMTSCGMGVPAYTYQGERETLNEHWRREGESGVRAYWESSNQVSIDGLPTHILAKSGV